MPPRKATRSLGAAGSPLKPGMFVPSGAMLQVMMVGSPCPNPPPFVAVVVHRLEIRNALGSLTGVSPCSWTYSSGVPWRKHGVEVIALVVQCPMRINVCGREQDSLLQSLAVGHGIVATTAPSTRRG